MIKIDTALPTRKANEAPSNPEDFTKSICDALNVMVEFEISPRTFSKAFNLGCIVDGRAGGYIVGRLHSEGHIPIILTKENNYMFASFAEGGEFLINHDASVLFSSELININSNYSRDSDTRIHLNGKLPRIIDARSDISTKAILVDGSQFIVTRKATRESLDRLIEINETANAFTASDPLQTLLSDHF